MILSEAVQAGYAVKSTNNDGETVYTLSYSVSETKGISGRRTAYTDTFFDFNVIVTDNGDGTLKAETQYPKDKNKFEFINTVLHRRTDPDGHQGQQDPELCRRSDTG